MDTKNIFVVLIIIANSYGQDVTTFINSKKSINIIDDRFISIVVDPIILMNGLNISSETLTLTKNLSPAFIRIQGFSTSQLSFSYNDDKGSNAMKLTVTPAMCTSLNGWLISANITPVFALSDRDRVNDAWNPKSVALPLMALADQMNTTCLWEIASDTAHKTLEQYANDVTVLRHILDAFPSNRQSWGVVGGELSRCAPPQTSAPAEGAEIARKLLQRIEASVDAVNWTPNPSSEIKFPAKIIKANPSISKRNPSIWTTAPRSSNPTSFKDALVWAKYLGQVASNGYNVIFRQPKVKEFYKLTPAFWVSKFHKMLMGNNVLDTRNMYFNDKKNCHIFAHCTKNKNYFGHEGAVTIFVVNLEESEISIKTKFPGMNFKNNKIHNYILTSKDDNSSEIYLNGELLTISDLQDRKIEFKPKFHRIKSGKSICFNQPGKSIGYYVIPISCSSACIHDEENFRPIHPISPDQIENSSIESKIDTTPESMNNLHEIIPNEEDSNEKYYKNSEILQETRHGNRLALESQNESKGKMNKSNKSAAGDKLDESAISFGDDITNLIIERAKQIGRREFMDIEQKIADLKQLLTTTLTSPSSMTNLKQNTEEIKLNTENTQIKHSEDIDPRKKRELISLEIPNMKMEKQARQIRKTSEEECNSAPLSLDPLSEYSYDCKRRGCPCNCGLKLASNILQKLFGNEKVKPDTTNEEILNAVHLGAPSSLTNMERNKSPDVQEIKMLLQQYQKEIKNIVTTINTTNDILPEIVERSGERNKFIEKNGNSIENAISKNRKKRKISADLMNESSRTKHLRQNKYIEKSNRSRNKRQPTKFQHHNDGENSATPIELLPENIRSAFLKQNRAHQEKVEAQLNSQQRRLSRDKILEEIKRNAQSARRESNIQKREILESDSDSVEKTSDDNRTTKFNKNVNNMQRKDLIDSDEDRTKETDTYLNEISKEGKNIPNYLKNIQEDVYLSKPKLNNEENILFKNTDEPTKQKIEDNDLITSTAQFTLSEMSNLPEPEGDDASSNSSEDEFVDALDSEDPSSLEDSSKDGLVDNVFHTMFDVLHDFHKKILEYLHYLSR